MALPLVSICIPSYKPGHFEICLGSALAQTYRHCEIIVSDDCPTEAIAEICGTYPARVKYSRNPNRGMGAQNNLRRLIDLAAGEYIKFLYDDDLLSPFCVQRLVEALENTRGWHTTLAFGHRDLIDEHSNFLEAPRNFDVEGITLLEGPRLIAMMAGGQGNVVGEYTSVLFRKADAFDQDGKLVLFELDGESYMLDDVTAWIQFALKGNAVIVPDVLSYFRKHTNSNSNPLLNPYFVNQITDWQRIAEFAHRRNLLGTGQLIAMYRSLARTYLRWSRIYPALAARSNELMTRAVEMEAG